MAKSLYYLCESCNNKWEDEYDKEFGDCDSECDMCGHDFSPFTNKKEYNKAIKKHESKQKKYEIKILFKHNGFKDFKQTKSMLNNQLEKVLEGLDSDGLSLNSSRISITKRK